MFADRDLAYAGTRKQQQPEIALCADRVAIVHLGCGELIGSWRCSFVSSRLFAGKGRLKMEGEDLLTRVCGMGAHWSRGETQASGQRCAKARCGSGCVAAEYDPSLIKWKVGRSVLGKADPVLDISLLDISRYA